MTDRLDAVFGALADPTRREIVAALLRDETTSVPALRDAFPITRQALAKHLGVLGEAGLVERAEGSAGREVRYRLRRGALSPAARWVDEAEAAWDARLGRLKRSVEGRDRRRA